MVCVAKAHVHDAAHDAGGGEVGDGPVGAAIGAVDEIRRAAHASAAVNVLRVERVEGAKPFHAGFRKARLDGPGVAAIESFKEDVGVRDRGVVGPGVRFPAQPRVGETKQIERKCAVRLVPGYAAVAARDRVNVRPPSRVR